MKRWRRQWRQRFWGFSTEADDPTPSPSDEDPKSAAIRLRNSYPTGVLLA